MMANMGCRKCIALALATLGLLFSDCDVFAKKRHRGEKKQPIQIDYDRDVKPILRENCYRCHGSTRQEAGLRLDTPSAIRKGSNNGAVLIPGDAEHSLLITMLNGTEDDSVMPPSGPRLAPAQIATVKIWIERGAQAPGADENNISPPVRVDHWAFRPPQSGPVPESDFSSHPIDCFLSAIWKSKGLKPSPPIERSLLLRRAYVDLIGLPPTREQLHEFIGDNSPDAYERAVDHLLASPQYGERWGRHWMDIWRYSDADGRKAKQAIWWGSAHIWRWRDWIIQSLISDKGYDRMVVEMLAGDEVAPHDPQALAATGYLVRNWFILDRNIWLNNTVEHTGRALLGITIGCARCHDHKFDPISQNEYYQFRAFFEPHDIQTVPYPGAGNDPRQMIAHAFDAHPDAPTWIYVRGDDKAADKSRTIVPGLPAALGGSALVINPIGNGAQTPSTGRRLALARHFGQPLVANMADFGARTEFPIQHELLDWLAVEFMEHDWSMKWLHRCIVTSRAYQSQSSLRGAPEANLEIDPNNLYLWRMNARRMEAEVVRDSLLCLAGALDPEMGGPPLDPARGDDSARRSLYYRFSREDKMDFLVAFDAAGVEECYRRQESIVPQQALALANSEFVWNQARRIAAGLQVDCPQALDHSFIIAAFEHVLGRAPQDAEIEACERFLFSQKRALSDETILTRFPDPLPPAKIDPEVVRRIPGLPLILGEAQPLPPVPPNNDPARRAREHLIHALLNHNDFITVR
jgi:Protein of unknown function (DUF1549)/Protein of unknown function (DUF1553)/Planctomycete cytochrome C